MASSASHRIPPALRSQVIQLYRQLLRLGYQWQAQSPSNTPTERQYILSETQRLFRANQSLTNPQLISEHIREAEARATMAVHYRNPYPRPVNVPPRSYSKQVGKRAGKAIQKQSELSKPIYVKSIDDTVPK
ncbi:LYR motif containing protein 1-like [Tigriopus californicus]|nr:LYR motif containing protein 1-like [Tigriopus californicus]